MGKGLSKEKAGRQIDALLDLEFQANCSASSSSRQEIELRGVTIVARDDCQINFFNRSTLNSTCDMAAILDRVATLAADADESFAKTLASADTAGEGDEPLSLQIRKKLSSQCNTSSDAMQTLRIIDSVFVCEGNTKSTYGNETDVRATCLRSVLHDADKKARQEPQNSNSGKLEDETDTSSSKKKKNNQGADEGDGSFETYVVIAFLLLFVVLALHLKNQQATNG